MGAWRGMVLLCSLALGCGGSPLEESDPEDERSQAGSPSEPEEGEPSALRRLPELGRARLIKDIFPPGEGPAWWGPSPGSLVEFRERLGNGGNGAHPGIVHAVSRRRT